MHPMYRYRRRRRPGPDGDDYFTEMEFNNLLSYINAVSPPPPDAQAATNEGAAAMVEHESVDPGDSPGIVPASENAQPHQSGPSSEHAAVPQLQTGNDVNTTLASQLASTTVTTPPIDQQSPMETSNSVEKPVVVSDLPEPDNWPSSVGSENEPSGSKPPVMDSDVGELEPRSAIPRVIVRDIVELEDGQSVVVPNKADLQSLQEQTGKLGQKRKVEEESESESETAPSPKEQKRDEKEEGDEELDEENEEVESEEEDRVVDLQDQADIVQRILHLFRRYRPRGPPTTLEQQLMSMRMSPLQYVYHQVTEIHRWHKMEARDPLDPGYYYHPYYMHREQRMPHRDYSDDDSGEDAPVDKDAVAKFPLSNEQRLSRLLIFGGVSRAMPAKSQPDRSDIATIVRYMIEEGNGEHVVNLLKEFSTSGRTARQDTLLFVLSTCCRSTDMKTKQAAYAAIQEICRIPTHIFELITYIESAGKTSGWGRGLRHAVTTWYNKKASNPQYLAMHITKYWNRHGWNHRDVFRLAHIKPVNDAIGFIVRYAVKGMKDAEEEFLQDGYLDRKDLEKVHKYLKAVEEAKSCQEASRAVQLIQEFNLVREQLATQMLNEPSVWSVMLPNMPLNALLRNLNKITSLGLFSVQENVEMVVSKLLNTEAMKNARVHPLKLLVAHRIYERGHGDKGSLQWEAHPKIVDALEKAFYNSFGLVESTNKRILIALDISGSMCGNLGDHPITMREASTVMAMVTIKREPVCDVVGFHQHLIPLEMFKDTSKTLKELVDDTTRLGFGSTDCSKPMTWARKHRKEYDAFIIYTDSETNMHKIPPYKALVKYRETMNIPTAKLVVVGMMNCPFSIADPSDIFMLDVVGFDPDCPEMIREFLVEGIE